jgi:CRP/FNR family transcriptional regulator, cyclic AMP receptor protein
MHGIIGGGGLRSGKSLSSFFLTEMMSDINCGGDFLGRLAVSDLSAVRRASTGFAAKAGATIFMQGDPHNGIYLIEAGRVRTFYASPSGKEITLAYWTPGHFIGGPEVFGGGAHVWSAVAVEDAHLSYLPGSAVRQLVQSTPAFAICLIDGLVAKGKCYSALVQMLGTRSVTERLAQMLLILAEVDREPGTPLVVSRRITHEQLASIVGSTRQWVTSTLARFQRRGLIRIGRQAISIECPAGLKQVH